MPSTASGVPSQQQATGTAIGDFGAFRSNVAGTSDSPTSTSLSCKPKLQTAAALFARRRIIPSAFSIPLLCIFAPMSYLLGRSFLSILSGGHPHLTSLVALAVWFYVRSCIIRHAPDDSKRQAALEAIEGPIKIMGMVLVVGVSFNFLIGPWSNDDAHRWDQTHGATMMLTGGIRLALGTTALSLAIVLRYIGAFSIMRSSSMPLRPNPIDLTVSIFKEHFSSVDGALQTVAGPDADRQRSTSTSNKLASHGSSSADLLGGRFMRPPLPVWLPQIFLHGFGGGFFAKMVASHLLTSSTRSSEASFAVLLVCTLTSILTVILTIFLDGSSHELKMQSRSDFLSRTSSLKGTFVSLAIQTSATLQKNFLPFFIVVLPVTINIVLFFIGQETTVMSSLVTTAVSWFAALFITTYLIAVDYLVRRSISTPVDVDRLVDCAIRPKSRTAIPFLAEDLIVQSIIWGCDGSDVNTIENIVAPRLGRATGPTFDLEEEECRRMDEAMEAVAKVMLLPRLPLSTRTAALEEDILRVAVLESLGGGGDVDLNEEDAIDEVQRSLGLPTPYYLAVRKRLLVSEELFAEKGQSIQQPLVVPLVRAFCAYAGGLGLALTRTASNSTSATLVGSRLVTKKNHRLGRIQLFVLPPGAASCAEFSLIAAARFFAMNAKLVSACRGGGSVSRRHNWLSLLAPAILHSTYQLHTGVMSYGRSCMEMSGSSGSTKAEENVGKYIALNCPDLQRLLASCNEVAGLIVSALKEQNGEREIRVRVHGPCKTWLSSL